ncbi:N-acetylmuramic acid 6-phosphate etherase [Tropicimonas sediminicola]|uniref:N-acetylmuramic acid 6-phosphate etherase n=1 Tax=Tropicimonas sediminicola TaxID=1031541 RepID=A0A239IAD5_9RHOB|nr:N-acetylmuramic acid 6-phosphate etherase [Tropicimonas sediminicola]SNS90268.1 N-acetylmuramic acid 6-phosphate etherase [Tropicimonas sediminicola]
MATPETEGLHPEARGLDARALPEIAALMLSSQQAALASVAGALDQIARGAELMAEAIRSGGSLVYAAAGSSGLMALADAAELEATFGLPADRIALHMAGGIPQGANMPGATEDDAQAALVAASGVQHGDAVIAISASGTTPYPLAFLREARARGARTIAIANNPGTPMLEEAEVAILLATPPEVVSGSTRLGAGTAQKATLNMMSTLMGIALGHVHDGMMVNLRADNAKLIDRATGMIARIADVSEARAAACLEAAGGEVKPAVLLAAGASAEKVPALLETHQGNLRAALARIAEET